MKTKSTLLSDNLAGENEKSKPLLSSKLQDANYDEHDDVQKRAIAVQDDEMIFKACDERTGKRVKQIGKQERLRLQEESWKKLQLQGPQEHRTTEEKLHGKKRNKKKGHKIDKEKISASHDDCAVEKGKRRRKKKASRHTPKRATSTREMVETASLKIPATRKTEANGSMLKKRKVCTKAA